MLNTNETLFDEGNKSFKILFEEFPTKMEEFYKNVIFSNLEKVFRRSSKSYKFTRESTIRKNRRS